MKKGIDVESGELNQSPAEGTVFTVVRKLLSRMRFLVVHFLLQLAAFGIIKSEFYAARILCHNLAAFLAFFCVWVLPLVGITFFVRPCWRSACFSIRNFNVIFSFLWSWNNSSTSILYNIAYRAFASIFVVPHVEITEIWGHLNISEYQEEFKGVHFLRPHQLQNTSCFAKKYTIFPTKKKKYTDI